MEKSIRQEIGNLVGWNEMIKNFPDVHFLQTEEWAAVKSFVGWESEQLIWRDKSGNPIAAANLLIRRVRLAGKWLSASIGYIPRGPLLDWGMKETRGFVLSEIIKIARRRNLIFVKIDPMVEIGRGIPGGLDEHETPLGVEIQSELTTCGWKYSPDQIQYKNTVVIDLTGSEDSWLARMKQKTRYNIRLAQKSGVIIRRGDIQDLEMLYRMYAATALRDGFIIRPREYYLETWKKFIESGMAEALVADVNGEPVAGLVYFFIGRQAWYVYGMSTNQYREKMPNYLLQWEAMRSAAGKGCEVYDLWGAPNQFDSTDPLFGVFRFKDGLGGEVVRTIGAWDFPNNRLIYFIYQVVLPMLLSVTRKLRKRQIKQEVL